MWEVATEKALISLVFKRERRANKAMSRDLKDIEDEEGVRSYDGAWPLRAFKTNNHILN